jgi:hypothetical protein
VRPKANIDASDLSLVIVSPDLARWLERCGVQIRREYEHDEARRQSKTWFGRGRLLHLRAPAWTATVARAVWTAGVRKRAAKLLRLTLVDIELRDALRAAALAGMVPQFIKMQSLRAA